MKTCKKCAQNKPDSDFYVVKGYALKQCKPCAILESQEYYYKSRKEKLQIWRRDNLEEARKKERDWRANNPDRAKGKLLRPYWPGSTWREALQKFRDLVSLQNNLCKICGKPETHLYRNQEGKVRDLSVDHCHKSGKVRGLLCDSCNLLISKAKDDPRICLAAAKYLEGSE